jgi:Mce-associated membrane protein
LTAVLEETTTEAVTEQVETSSLASWWSRAGAFALDVLFIAGVVAAGVLVTLTVFNFQWWVPIATGAAVLFLLVELNRLLAPAVTGWSLGRAAFGIAVARSDGTRPGPWWLLARDAAHLLDTVALCVGWLWPLWDSRNRTFADLLVGTEVHKVDGERPTVRRAVAAVLTAGAVIAASGAGLTYVTAYRHDQAVDAARAQIAEQGPRIVEQILTYNAGTMKDDFMRAQSLVTDDYRKQLVQQQQVVEKKAAASNEYWSVTSSVLPGVSPERATMLIFLQGQRQAQQQDIKFITATARVDFDKSRDGRWLVSNLTVLQQPVLGKPQ